MRLCRWLEVPRSSVYYHPRERAPRSLDQAVVSAVIDAFPTFGIRRVWAYLRFRLKQLVNRTKIARIMRIKGWTVNKRPRGGGPRVKATKSVTSRPDQRWATDLAVLFCGARDGLVHSRTGSGLLHTSGPGLGTLAHGPRQDS